MRRRGVTIADYPLDHLSPRERQVFGLVVGGICSEQIAALLRVSRQTVRSYRKTMMRKLDIRDIAGLMAFAEAKGLADLRAQPVPGSAEFLFHLFVDAKNCDALVGDLEERYRLLLQKFGPRKATFWYWTQALRSLVPIVWAWVKRFGMKPLLAGLGWTITSGFLRDGLLMDLAKKVLSQWLKRLRG